jgi:hypothetical protein
MTARPGSYCSPVGSTDATVKGTLMVCDLSGPRARWRGADRSQSDRRALLKRARELGIKIKRNTPSDQISQMISSASIPTLPAVIKPSPPAVPEVTATPLSNSWFQQRTARFEHLHPRTTEPVRAGRPSFAEVRDAFRQAVLVEGGDPDVWGGTYASAAAVKRRLPYKSADIDAALVDMDVNGKIILTPESNQKVLLDLERTESPSMGNQRQHLLQVPRER